MKDDAMPCFDFSVRSHVAAMIAAAGSHDTRQSS
jgi:hypothetical protein